MSQSLLPALPNMDSQEFAYIQTVADSLTAEEKQQFMAFYSAQRKDPQTVMLLALLGFVVAAGVHRFYLGQVGMGILYFLTGGLCLVGTILDLVNYKKLASEYNQMQMVEAAKTVKMLNGKR